MAYRLPPTSLRTTVAPGAAVMINPQPLPPRWGISALNPQPLPPGPPPPDMGIIAILIG